MGTFCFLRSNDISTVFVCFRKKPFLIDVVIIWGLIQVPKVDVDLGGNTIWAMFIHEI